MAFKQPRVPEYRENENVNKYLKALVLFLKDFCQDSWTASRNAGKAIEKAQSGVDGISYPVTSVNKKTGDVTLAASDVGALASGATAANAAKLDGESLAGVLLRVYPVGSIYMSVSSTSPASRFGGTWEQLKDRFLLGAGDSYSAGSTGGAASVALTKNQLPKIEGTASFRKNVNPGAFRPTGVFSDVDVTTTSVSLQTTGTGSSTEEALKISFGNNEAHENMPPYLAVYMWKRVS